METGIGVKPGRIGMKDTNLFEDLQFQEEMVIDGESVNFYFGLMILELFREKHEQQLIMSIIRAYKTEILTPDDVKRKCRGFVTSIMRQQCQSVAKLYFNPDEPCFLQEQRDRRSLKEKGVSIINEGNHATDLLHILNRIRGGRMNDIEHMLYYVRRIYLYLRIYTRPSLWRPMLMTGIRNIFYEWCDVGDNDEEDFLLNLNMNLCASK